MSGRERTSVDCCTGTLESASELERTHQNRPGLPAVSYRLGLHDEFFTRMLKRLPNQRDDEQDSAAPPLGRLTYRGQDDPTIALLDACATVLDVLAFYQERIANESFIRTATERRSVLELARSIGYELRPGVAASTLLTFTVDDAPGSPERVLVPEGTQVLSIPKKDELPQIFETVQPLEARVEWNQISVQVPTTALEQTIRADTTAIFLARLGPRLAAGDIVLLVGFDGADERRIVRRVHRVTDFPGFHYRRVDLQPAGEEDGGILAACRIYRFGLRAGFFGHSVRNPDGREIQILRVLLPPIVTPVQCVALASASAGLGASGFELVPDPPEDARAAAVPLRADQAVEMEADAETVPTHRTLRIWNLEEDREERALDISETITAVAFSSDDAYLAATTHDAVGIHVYVWEVSTGTEIVSAVLPPDATITQEGPVRAIRFQRDEAGSYRITTINDAQTGVFWDARLTATPELSPLAVLDLSGLGDLVGEPLVAEEALRSLQGSEEGGTMYRAREVFDTVPDEVSLADAQIDLDNIYRKLIPASGVAGSASEHSWVLLTESRRTGVYEISEVSTRHRSDYGITKRVSRLGLDLSADSSAAPAFSLRETEIYADSQELTLARVDVALPTPIQGSKIQVTEATEDLAGRTVIIRGRPVTGDGGQPTDPPGGSITSILGDGTTRTFRVETRDDEDDEDDEPLLLVDDNGFMAELEDAGEIVQWDEGAAVIHEIANIARVEQVGTSPPCLVLSEPLQHVYDWRSTQILANVATATHGETLTEVLGSGDGLLRNQRFKLSKPPLTYVPASNESGLESTLQIRVNGVLWSESGSLLELEPTDETYTVRIQNDGATDVFFGDGVRGARLPSGAENVTARYRSGLGAAGEVEAEQLALLKTKPLGIRSVINPFPASGAELPETEGEARERAPLTVLVLGRVVSIQDYEDFSKTFPGVGKAQATPLWDGFNTFAHLTVGTQGGAPIEPGEPLYESLLGALDEVRDTHQLVTIQGYRERYFGLSAKILVDERYLPEPVLQAVASRLRETFSYQARDFGQDVTAAEIVAAMHEIAGVVAADLDTLYFADEPMAQAEIEPAATQRLEAALASLEDGLPKAAELLLLHPGGGHLVLEEMS